ncbi:unnamed protein product [Cladocopium goreaui]|uniref:C2 domain-containing protein n=1 Tax=Cladocopium goreaui TaxID=2562237 RepID=A0A9P1DDY5_9DINO|nr:unnamed protein product [Cladocopium goreaui]
MLDLPELLSVRPQELLSSEIYTVPAGGSVSSQLQLQSPCIFRVVAEPTDTRCDATTGSVSTAATGSGFVQQLPAGTYELIFKSDDQALADAVPFFVTWGIRATSADTGAVSCDGLARIEDATVGGTARQGAKEFKKQLNIAALPNALKLPVTVPQPAVATIASWSPFTQHYVRVALVSDEGLWVGEQRGRRSSLEIELPPGDYQMTVEEMSPLSPPAGCMAMGVAVSLVPFSAIERSSSAVGSVPPFLGSSLGLGARCDGLGALPLPLDAISDTGGSAAYGGPVDADGRLLIRERIMLTDIHDGRKKVFLRLPAASMLRVAVVSEDAMETEVVLEDSSHQQIAPVESHIMGEGQAASYIMEAPASGLWVSFHREHRVAQTSGCASFDLLMQSAPMQDMVKMSACGEPRELREMVEKVLEHFHESTISSAEGRLRIPGTTSGSGSASTGALHLRLAEESLVEVEVQFNFMLSNVHLWLDSGLGRGLAPRVRAHGTAAAEKNAAAQLRLRLDAGDHVVRIRHDPAFPAEASPIKLLVASPQCAPLSLKLRRVAVRAQRPVVSMPMAPLVSGSDLVLHLDAGSSGSSGSSAALAQKPPSAASQGGYGGHTLAWSSQVLSGLLGVSGRQVSPAAGHPGIPWDILGHPRTSFPMRLISLTRLRRRPWRARCSAQLVPVAPSSPVPVAVVPEPPVEEPGECATFRYASPGAARAALTSLLGRRDASRRNEALYVLRGAKMAELRDLAQRTEDELMELKSEKQVTVALRRFLLDAASIELQIEDAVEQLVTLTPLPLEALLAAFATQHGRVMLGAAGEPRG